MYEAVRDPRATRRLSAISTLVAARRARRVGGPLPRARIEQVELLLLDLLLEDAEARLLPRVEDLVQRFVLAPDRLGRLLVEVAQRLDAVAQGRLVGGDRAGAVRRRSSWIILLRACMFRRRVSCSRFSRATNWPY